MLWLNPSKGDVIEAPKRPSPAWVTIVGVKIGNQNVESTLEGLRRAMMKSDAYTLRPNDFEWMEKTGLNVYAHEAWWLKTITDADFPYIKMIIASDGTLEIRYDENAKDDTSKDTIRTKEISEDDSPLKRGGQRGTGKSGQGGGGGEGIPGGEEPSEPSEEPDEPTEPSKEPEPEPSEDRDAYEEGKEKADSISDDLKEKMKGKMEGKGEPMEGKGEPTTGGKYIPPEDTLPFDPTEGTRLTDESDPSDALTGDLTGEAGEPTTGGGTPTEGEGDGEGDGGEGQGDGDGEGEGEDGSGGDGEPCDTCGESGEECSCDDPSDGETEPTDDPQDASGDGGDSDSDTDSEDDTDDGQESGEKDEKDGKGDELGLPPEEKDALDQCVEEAEDGRDKSQEAYQEADSEKAKEGAQEAQNAADEAKEIADRNGQDPEDNEKVQEAQEYADEADEFADLAEELEEEIKELFEESGLDEEDYEEFKEGLLDELFGEDSEFSDELTEREKRLKEKIERREKNKKSRGLVRCVNWETGKIKSFSENETIGDTWIPITSFFSPFETANGKQIVVDRTIEGAVNMAKALGIKTSDKTAGGTIAIIHTKDEAFIDALKKMRMFDVNDKGDTGKIIITY